MINIKLYKNNAYKWYNKDNIYVIGYIILEDKNYLVTGYSLYEDTYLTKFTLYSNALKELGINQ